MINGGHRPFGGYEGGPQMGSQGEGSPRRKSNTFGTVNFSWLTNTWLGRAGLYYTTGLASSPLYDQQSLNPFDFNFNPHIAQLNVANDVTRTVEVVLPLIILDRAITLGYRAWKKHRRGY